MFKYSLINRIKISRVIVLFIILTSSISYAQIEQDEFYDPMKLEIPDALNIKEIPYNETTLPQDIGVAQTSKKKEVKILNVQGFRVQLISTQDVSQAETVELKAIELFETDVYLVFEYPNYKVRVGNFMEIRDSRKTEQKARRNGFPRAWTVPSEIKIKNMNERY